MSESSGPVPDAAVEAFRAAWNESGDQRCRFGDWDNSRIRAALTAAQPALTRQAVTDELKEAAADAYALAAEGVEPVYNRAMGKTLNDRAARIARGGTP